MSYSENDFKMNGMPPWEHWEVENLVNNLQDSKEKVAELEKKVSDLEKENAFLKETNKALLSESTDLAYKLMLMIDKVRKIEI